MKTKVTINKAVIECSPFEVMAHFETLIDRSQWQDTGGGWRSTYRTLEKMLVEYVKTGENQTHNLNYGPKILVEVN